MLCDLTRSSTEDPSNRERLEREQSSPGLKILFISGLDSRWSQAETLATSLESECDSTRQSGNTERTHMRLEYDQSDIRARRSQ